MCSCLRGVPRCFTLLDCGPNSPQLVSRFRMASKLFALQMHTWVVFRMTGSDADAPVRLQLSGGFVLTIASTPSVGCDALCVRVLGGHTPVDRVQANPCVVRRVCVDFLRLGVQSD